MARSLVIVESPAKARTINRYLGKDFIVKSSIGHIRDLPTGGKTSDPKARAKEAAKTRKLSAKAKETYRKQRARTQLVRRMGVDPEHDWKATYEILPGKEKVVDELRKLAEKSDQIYLATDLDREGEAIAWHLKETIGGDPDRYRRVVFNEITRKAHSGSVREPDVDRRQSRQRAAGAAVPRPRRRLRAVAAAVGESRAGSLCRPRSVGSGAADRRTRARNSRVHSGGILGSIRRPEARERR